MTTNRHQVRLADARNGIAGDQRFVAAFKRGTLSAELYTPIAHDPQQPHSQDEFYIVQHGHGTFLCGGEELAFGPGDLLFVAAGVEHRFLNFSDDLAVWVIFSGPDGGEQVQQRTILGCTMPEIQT